MPDILSPYAKAVVAAISGIVIAVLVAVRTASGDGWSLDDVFVILLALFQAVGVYLVPNKEKTP